jgi:hypothetical protein
MKTYVQYEAFRHSLSCCPCCLCIDMPAVCSSHRLGQASSWTKRLRSRSVCDFVDGLQSHQIYEGEVCIPGCLSRHRFKPISEFLVQSSLLFVKKDECHVHHFILVCYGDGVVLALASSRGPGGCDFATDFTNDMLSCLMAKIQKVIDNTLFPSKILSAH